MRIGMALPRLGFLGGIEKYAWDLSGALAARGHHLRLLHGDAEGRDPKRFLSAFAEHRPVGAGCADDLEVVYVQRAARLEDLAPFGGRPLLIASHDHDHTCLRRHRYLPLNLQPCHRAPGPGCFTHGCFVLRDRTPEARFPVVLGNPLKLRSRLRALSARAPLAACSDYIARNLIAGGASADRVHTLHSIPPESDAQPTPRPETASLLFVGQLIRGKGLDIAIEALEHMPETTLTVAGDGPSRTEWESLARDRAPGRVRFVGYVQPQELDRVYDEASVVVVPSRWPEPFGMIGIEAMRRGRPVAGANHGGIPEWMGEGGLLFTPADPRDMARAVRTLVADRAAGERALAHARENFPHSRLTERAEQLLRAQL